MVAIREYGPRPEDGGRSHLVEHGVAPDRVWPLKMFRHQVQHSLMRRANLLALGPRNQFLQTAYRLVQRLAILLALLRYVG